MKEALYFPTASVYNKKRSERLWKRRINSESIRIERKKS